MDFHWRLSKRRNSLQISIRRISEDLKVSKSTYEKWESHRFPRHPETYQKLAQYLKTSTDYLMFGKEKDEQSIDEYVWTLRCHFKFFQYF